MFKAAFDKSYIIDWKYFQIINSLLNQFCLYYLERLTYKLKMLQIISIQNCLQFHTAAVIYFGQEGKISGDQ